MDPEVGQIKDLVGKALDSEGFSVKSLAGVYMTNENGMRVKTLGFFKDWNVAGAFAQSQKDASHHKVAESFVLTNGKHGFVIGEPVTLLDDEKATLEIREKALAKLSPEEKAVLGL